MLQLLFTLMLELGLLGGPAKPQPNPNPNQISTQTTITTETSSSLELESPGTDVTLGTDVSIGGSGWDDKN